MIQHCTGNDCAEAAGRNERQRFSSVPPSLLPPNLSSGAKRGIQHRTLSYYPTRSYVAVLCEAVCASYLSAHDILQPPHVRPLVTPSIQGDFIPLLTR